MAHDDDRDADADAEPTAAELAHARRFAELVDKTLTGRAPPAMSADDRALLEVATVIRATRGQLELADDRRRAIVEDALRQAIGAEPAGGLGGAAAAGEAGDDVASFAQARRRRARRWAPWVVAGASGLVAAAAVALLWLRPPQRDMAVSPTARHAGHAGSPAVPVEWRSRSADALIGPIARDAAGDASARIDAIFADRLDGFRARRLTRSATRGAP